MNAIVRRGAGVGLQQHRCQLGGPLSQEDLAAITEALRDKEEGVNGSGTLVDTAEQGDSPGGGARRTETPKGFPECTGVKLATSGRSLRIFTAPRNFLVPRLPHRARIRTKGRGVKGQGPFRGHQQLDRVPKAVKAVAAAEGSQ